ncbi:MAG: hypothetical protein ABI581_06455 [Sediminibacterium sp.]
MKTLFIPLIAGLLLSCSPSPAQNTNQDTREKEKQEIKEKEREEKQQAREVQQAERNRVREIERRKRYNEKYPEQFKEHISKQYTLQRSTGASVVIYNLEGSVRVEGYAGDKVLIEVDKTISAKDKETLEQGKKEVKVEFEQIGDSVVAYIREPWDTRPHDWRDQDDNYWSNRRRIEYNCALQFVVKVPFNVNLRASTVNDGEVVVKDVAGKLNVSNVNGGIEIVNAKGTTKATTVNGDLTVNYTSNPPEASSFYTLNGKLTATFQPNLSADLQFKSMNGAFYTDFDNTEVLPPVVTKNQENKGKGTIYKLNKDTKLRIGAGGKQFKFETLNGNIYIKKQS